MNELLEVIQPLLNQIGNALNLYPADSLLIKSIPVIISVFNELITFTDGKIVEERLKQLEEGIEKLGYEVEEFKQSVENLDEHNQFVLRRYVKDYCLAALPETIQMRILAIIEFVMSQEHDFSEEICEITAELNRTDLEVLDRIFSIVTNKELVRKRGQEARDKINNSTGKIKDRVYYLPKQTVLWEDFTNIREGEAPASFCNLLNYHIADSEGKDNFNYAMECRSLLKLQSLGVITIDSQPLWGPTPVNNVCQFHLTVFGVKLMEYVERGRDY